MTWNRWLLALKRHLRPTRSLRPARRLARPSRLTLERLEDRTVFSVQVLTTALPVPSTGATTANGQSELSPMHAISDDGRYTVYTSAASNLVSNQAASATGKLNIYLYDSKSGSTTLITHESGNSTTTLATTANGDSFNAVISGDGSTVAFYSVATNLAAQDPSGNSVSVSSGDVELYAYNVSTGKTTLVSHDFGSDTLGSTGANPAIPSSPSTHWLNTLAYSAGSAALGEDINGLALPSLSKDGKYIAYIDDATDLAAADTGLDAYSGLANTNVFLYDNNSGDSGFGTNTLVSHAAGNATTTASGSTSGGGAYASTTAISADGSTVAFTDPGTNLLSSQNTDGVSDQLYVWSRINNSTTGLSAGQTILASHKYGSDTVGATIPSSLSSFYGYSQDSPPTLSADGNNIAYYYAGKNLVNGQAGTASVLNVFLYNVSGDTNTLVTHVNGTSSTNLVTAGNNPQNQVAAPGQGPVEASGPQISADGKYIAYANNSNNLVASNTSAPWSTWNGADNVYLYDNNSSDSAYQTNILVSNNGSSATSPDAGGGTAPSISADGRYVTFMDLALPSNLPTDILGNPIISGKVTGASNASDIVITTSSTAALATGDIVYITGVGGNTAANNSSSTATWTIKVVDSTHFSLNGSSGNGTYTSGGTWTIVAGTVNVRLFDREASSSSQPTVIGQSFDSTFLPPLTGSGSNLPASLFLYASALAPTVISGDGSTVVWDGPADAHSMASSVTDSNTNLDVFQTTGGAAITFTSANTTTFTVGTSGSFSVTATASPSATISESGSLPSGVTFTASTGTLSGTPKAGTGGSYTLTFTAHNGVSTDVTQTFTFKVNEAPGITSTNTATFTVGTSGSFTVGTSGYPSPTFSESGTLPGGVTLDKTSGKLSGTPNSGTGGKYTFTITATNSVGTDATQTFTLVVDEAPGITSTSTKTFTVGSSDSFTLTTTGYPSPTFSESGTLPGGITFDKTAGTLSGTPKTGTGGKYNLTITATNSIGTDATQSFTIVVNEAPGITSTSTKTFTVGSSDSFTVTTSGYPSATVTESGTLPTGLSYDKTTGVLSGKPGTGTGGKYGITFTASNGVGTDATQSFTIVVNEAPTITSGNFKTFTVGSSDTFTLAASGYPSPSFTESGSLPGGLTFNKSAGTLSGTPNTGTGGKYNITFTASNGVGTDATQNFTIYVDEAPGITSANNKTFTVGTSDSFTLTTSGYPSATVTESGTLSTGLSYDKSTGVLSGKPGTGTGGAYTVTFTASNGVGTDATQSFTIYVDESPSITSANNTTFTVGSSDTFTLAATGYPSPSYSESGSLPNGLTFNKSAGTVSGTPNSGTGGAYSVTFTASNGVGTDAKQNFKVYVDETVGITSAGSTTFTTGSSGSFAIITSGYPAPAFTLTGTLPSGVSFDTSTGTFSGSPDAGTGGVYKVTVTASNGVGAKATQNFTFVVAEPASIISTSASFNTDSSSSFTLKTSGYPSPTFTLSGTLPSGVTFDPTTGTFSGQPKAGTTGVYPVTITASNGIGTKVTKNFVLTVYPVPFFTGGADQTADESAAATPDLQTVSNWATNILVGPSAGFVVTNDNNSLFSTQPAVGLDGTLTYRLAQYAFGTSTVAVTLTDNSGARAYGPVYFHITALKVNQPPSFTPGADLTVQEDNGADPIAYTYASWAKNISAGPPNEASQLLTFTVTNDNNSLFATQPNVDSFGTLTFDTTPHASGTATVTVFLRDDGGTANGGKDTYGPVTFTITVTAVPVPTTTTQAMVMQTFTDLLGRQIRPDEMSYWNAQIAAGMTPLQVAQSITHSQEFYTNLVSGMFQTYLGRTLDSGGQNLVQQLVNGATVQQVEAQILSSDEYFNKSGGTTDAWITALYHDVLGMPADQTAFSYWEGQLASGQSRTQVALAIINSQAGLDRVVRLAYQQLLGRTADAASVQYWANQLQQGMSIQNFYANIVSSNEFGTNAYAGFYNSSGDEAWLNQVFEDTLGRAIRSDETSQFVDQLRTGTSHLDIVNQILASQEYQEDQVKAAFLAILRRTPTDSEVTYYENLYSGGDTIQQIDAKLYGSAEYFGGQGGGTFVGFVDALYRDALGRAPSDTDVADWMPSLNNGVSTETVALSVLTSGEAYGVLVSAGYTKFLRRSVDDTGKTYWVGQMDAGMTAEQFYAQLLSSAEYYSKYSY
jgi:hypothetical protein